MIGHWDGIINHGAENGDGGVSYNKEEMALEFDGVDDYLELTKPGSFGDGFTFEIYGDVNRFVYDKQIDGLGKIGGLFCKMQDLGGPYGKSMRFMFFEELRNGNYYEKGDYMFCKFIGTTNSIGVGDKLKGEEDGGVVIDRDEFECRNSRRGGFDYNI